MGFPFYIARRYLVSKKSHNIINVVSLISIVGILVSTAAMVIVLSAFNGFEGVVENLYTSFDSDLKIELKEGKSFDSSQVPEELAAMAGIQSMNKVIEEIILVKHEDRWVTCTMKGLQEEFLINLGLDSMLTEGFIDLGEGRNAVAIIGSGIKNRLGVTADPRYMDRVSVHGLVRTKNIKKNTQPFNTVTIPIGGVFNINPEFDEKFFMVSLNFASNLLEYDNEITGIELNCEEDADLLEIKDQIQALFGSKFMVKTYFEKNALMYQVHQSEKGMTFIILTFILVLSSFTLIASLTMLVIDKKSDIRTLVSMGATNRQIRRVFFLEGILINFVGAFVGIALGYAVCWIQIKFHVIKLGGAIVPYYPIRVEWFDFALILAATVLIGVVATYFPVRYLVKRHFD